MVTAQISNGYTYKIVMLKISDTHKGGKASLEKLLCAGVTSS